MRCLARSPCIFTVKRADKIGYILHGVIAPTDREGRLAAVGGVAGLQAGADDHHAGEADEVRRGQVRPLQYRRTLRLP